MVASRRPTWNWREEGFIAPPIAVRSPPRLRIYRIWGGTSTELGSATRPGVCFSFHAPATRREAERLFAVWEWGNSCSHISTFEVGAGATLFVGKVDPGDWYQCGLGATGSQVFIETADARRHVRRIGPARLLGNDMGAFTVVPNRDPGARRSS
jgi:hypothetical protein